MFERENHFPMGKERRDLIAEGTREISRIKTEGTDKKGDLVAYKWTDSGLDRPGLDSHSYQNQFGSLYESLGQLLPSNEKSLQQYIENALMDKKGKAIGIELGGIGSTLFSEFTPGFFEKSIGITLTDHRQKKWFDFDKIKKRDQSINHTVMIGDVLDRNTLRPIAEWLDGDKVDLIIERMAVGLNLIPAEPYLLADVIQSWYRLLSDGGLMLIQVPVALNPILDAWGRMLQKKCRDTLEVQYNLGDRDETLFHASAIRILKLHNAPLELPLLDSKTVFHTRKHPIR
ncbi:MAG: hypothetical protein AAB798_00635 [Patescibacteria group bacterium]